MKRRFENIEFAEPAPKPTDPTPTTPDMLRSQATVGALLAICGCADTLIRQGKLDKRLHQHMGLPALNRMYQEVDKLNHRFESIWKTNEADQMGYVHTDFAVIAMVLASVDLESRTNVANEFRKVWAKLQENLGDDAAFEKVLTEIAFIREQRGLASIEQLEAENTKAVFNTLSFFKDGHKEQVGEIQDTTPTAVDMLNEAMQKAKEYYTAEDFDEFARQEYERQKAEHERLKHLRPNCMIFVRSKENGNLLLNATVQVVRELQEGQEKPEVVDVITYEADGIFERQYPTGEKLLFSASSEGYLLGGCEKFFYAEDPEQLVVNIFLTQIPS